MNSFSFPKIRQRSKPNDHATDKDRLAIHVFCGMALGVGLGLFTRIMTAGNAAKQLRIDTFATHVLDPLGQIFLRLLFIVVIPLVFCSLASGVARLSSIKELGPLARRTFGLFFLNMGVGVALGLLVMNLVKPGSAIDAEMRIQMISQFSDGTKLALERAADHKESFGLQTFIDMFLPRNILKSVVDFQILPLILFALLLGAAATESNHSRRQSFVENMDSYTEFMTRIVGWALRLAPFGVFALLLSVTLRFGADFLKPLLLFTCAVLGVMAFHLFVSLRIILKAFGKTDPRKFYREIKTVLLTAFSTSSSSATLPASIKVAEERLGVSPSVAGFVLPLGATMNMSGTALYEGSVVLFVAQVYGIDLDLAQQVVLLLMSVLSAVAVAGIPGASLPLIVGMMGGFGIPGEGIALILGVDRILDMARTTLNVGADVATAVIVQDQTEITK
jgi:DAACS family dicarboxylate/amino acid:cation (Na+ or H+) symporter